MQLRALIKTRRGISHLRPETVGHGERLLPRKRLGTTLAVAMSPDELPSQPRKASWKRWIVVSAGVVAVIMIALLAIPPKEEPVNVWFVRATNEAGERRLVFEGTNGTAREGALLVGVIIGAAPYVETVETMGTPFDAKRTHIAPGTKASITLKAPATNVSFHVVWAFQAGPRHATPWQRLDLACYNFFRRNGMPSLAKRFWPTPEFHYVPPFEINE